MSGMEVLQEVVRRTPDVPVVMITAHGDVETAVEAMQRGAATFIQKPFTLAEIRKLVTETLDPDARSRRSADRYAERIQQAKACIGERRLESALEHARQAVPWLPRGRSRSTSWAWRRSSRCRSPRRRSTTARPSRWTRATSPRGRTSKTSRLPQKAKPLRARLGPRRVPMGEFRLPTGCRKKKRRKRRSDVRSLTQQKTITGGKASSHTLAPVLPHTQTPTPNRTTRRRRRRAAG